MIASRGMLAQNGETAVGVDFGATLKEWRQVRRVSQLDLALDAGVSGRHISFLETGRSRPSRGMILRLCDALEVPIAHRNQMLMAAGLSPAYADRDLSEEEMAPVREAVQWTLQRHEPYPAMAIDRHWCLVDMNRVSAQLMATFGVQIGDSLIDLMLDNPLVRAALENYDEVLRHMASRLRVESGHFGQDTVLDAAIARIDDSLAGVDGTTDGIKPAVIPTVYHFGGMRLSMFSTISQFGSTEDIALSELRIEQMYPADAATRLALEAMALAVA